MYPVVPPTNMAGKENVLVTGYEHTTEERGSMRDSMLNLTAGEQTLSHLFGHFLKIFVLCL
jgi:hypothetical protein